MTTLATGYQYTQRDLLAEPHHYHYAPFEGAAFLATYRHDRQRLRDALGGETTVATGCPVRGLPLPTRRASFTTGALLTDLAQAETSSTWHAWLDALRKRFEVTKRLYDEYGSDLRPTSERFRTLDHYARLASLLMRRYDDERGLQDLNATLKLLDVVSAAGAQKLTSLGRSAAARAVDAELAAIELLCHEQGVEA